MLIISLPLGDQPTWQKIQLFSYNSLWSRGYVGERKEKSHCLICLSRLEATIVEVATKPYPIGYQCPSSNCLMAMKEILGSMLYASPVLQELLPTIMTFAWESSQILQLIEVTLGVNLKPALAHDQEHLVSLFSTKFFCPISKLHWWAWPNTKTSRGGCGCLCEEIPRSSPRLLRRCLLMFASMTWWKSTELFWKIFLFPLFSRLIEAARHSNETVRRTLRYSFAYRLCPMIQATLRKRPIVVTLEKIKGPNLLVRRGHPLIKKSLTCTKTCLHFSMAWRRPQLF